MTTVSANATTLAAGVRPDALRFLLDRIAGAEVIIAPLEHNVASLWPRGRDAVVAARARYPLATG